MQLFAYFYKIKLVKVCYQLIEDITHRKSVTYITQRILKDLRLTKDARQITSVVFLRCVELSGSIRIPQDGYKKAIFCNNISSESQSAMCMILGV